MTIQVISNSDPVAAPAAVKDAVETKPELATEAGAEQNESTESGTEETEAKEVEAEESEETESEEETEAKEDSEGDKPKKKSGSQRRKERAERAEAEVARLQKLVEEMALRGAGESKPEKVEAPKPAVADGEPNPDDFDTHAEYVRAVARWEAKQIREEERRESQKKTLETEQENALKAHFDRVDSFKKANKDYDEVLADAGDIKLSSTATQLIIQSEVGPAIIYELAKNPEEAERLANLGSNAVAFELGKLEAKLTAKASEPKKPEPNKTTKAPKPIEPVGGKGASVSKDINDPNLTQSEFETIRRKQLAARKSAW